MKLSKYSTLIDMKIWLHIHECGVCTATDNTNQRCGITSDSRGSQRGGLSELQGSLKLLRRNHDSGPLSDAAFSIFHFVLRSFSSQIPDPSLASPTSNDSIPDFATLDVSFTGLTSPFLSRTALRGVLRTLPC